MKDLRAAAGNNGGENKAKKNSTVEDDTVKTINNYAKMSEPELMSELMSAVSKGRAGGLSNADLDSFVSRSQAFLTPEQTERMKSIVAGLKKPDCAKGT